MLFPHTPNFVYQIKYAARLFGAIALVSKTYRSYVSSTFTGNVAVLRVLVAIVYSEALGPSSCNTWILYYCIRRFD